MEGITLLHGDCLDLLPSIPDHSVDAVICDLPYGTTQNKWDSIIPLDRIWQEVKRLIKPSGAVVLFGSEPFTSLLICSNLAWFKYKWTWDKSSPTGHLNAHHQPMRRIEDIAVFYQCGVTYNAQGLVYNPRKKSRNSNTPGSQNYGKHSDNNIAMFEGYPTDLLEFTRDKSIHPTQKPLLLLEYLIRTYTHEDQTVLDFTMGSGTCGEACINTNRRFIGIEKDDHYFKIATDRIANTQAPLVTV